MINLLKKIFSKSKDTAYCPVCNTNIEHFDPLPSFFSEQAKQYGYQYFGKGEMIALESYSCPKCSASDRERIYAHWLTTEFSKLKIPVKMLHFAPEKSLSSFIQSKFKDIEYKTADLFMDNVDYKADLLSLPFDDNSFDCFICSHVLEHVDDDDKAISELYRILKPKGWGILMAPICTELEHTIEDPSVTSEEDRWKYYGQNDHVRLYAHNDYVNKIQKHGFVVQKLDMRYFGKKVFNQLGLTDTSILYIVEK